MKGHEFNPPPSAATLLPSAAPLVVAVNRDGSELVVHCSCADSTEIVYRLQWSERDGVEGDAPAEVIAQVERFSFADDSFDDEWERDERPTYASESHYEGGAA